MGFKGQRHFAGFGSRRFGRAAIYAAFLLALAAGLFGVSAGTAPVLAASGRASVWKVYPPGWNLVAGPDGSRLALHGETLFDLNGTTSDFTVNNSPLAQAGDGYWVYYPEGALLMLIGTPVDISSVHVDGGHWATIGNSGTRPASVRGADMAFTYEPRAGFSSTNVLQPGQAAFVYTGTDADVLLDPFSVPAPLTGSVGNAVTPPAFPGGQGISPVATQPSASTPMDELNYLIAVNPIITDVETRLADFADGLALADPSRPTDPIFTALRGDASDVANQLVALRAINPPPRYVAVNAVFLSALQDISDGMNNTIAGLLNGQPERVSLGAGELASGARKWDQALALLPPM